MSMKLRDRIKSLRRVKASDLLPNPRNWREHSEAQADAMRGILAEVGYVGAVLARETPDGLQLIDGHLRAEIDPNGKIPVLILDVTAEEADKILATFDPLAAMAEANEEALAGLLAEIETDSAGLQAMLDVLAAENRELESGPLTADQIRQAETETEAASPRDGVQPDTQEDLTRLPPPKCPIVPRYAEHYEAFVIVCDNTIDEAWIRNRLELESPQKSYKDGKQGSANILTVDQLRRIVE